MTPAIDDQKANRAIISNIGLPVLFPALFEHLCGISQMRNDNRSSDNKSDRKHFIKFFIRHTRLRTLVDVISDTVHCIAEPSMRPTPSSLWSCCQAHHPDKQRDRD